MLDSQSTGPGGTKGDWWSYDPNGIDKGLGSQGYHKRIGRTISDALGGAGYYTDSNSQMNLGANFGTLVDLARAKAAAEGNISGTSNPDTVKNYLKQYLKQYLTTGNMGAATGIAGPGSTGTNYRDAFGQINANAAAGTPEQKNWYAANSASIEGGLRAMNDLQTGGGLRSANANTIGDVFDRQGADNRFWLDANGQAINPWGGNFSSRLQPPPAPTPGPSDSPGNPANPTPPPTGNTLPVMPPAQPIMPGQAPSTTVPNTPWTMPNIPAADYSPPTQPSAPPSYAPPAYDQTVDTLWKQLFGREATPSERTQWFNRLQERYGGDINAMANDLRTSAPAQKFAQTGVAAPVVNDANDRAGAQSYYDWLQPGQSPEEWIQNYLSQLGEVNRR